MEIDTATVDSEIERKFKATFQGLILATKQRAPHILFSSDFDLIAMELDMAKLGIVEA
jgi:hypothetical protein